MRMGNLSKVYLVAVVISLVPCVIGVEILSKSKLQRCEKNWESDNLNCSKKIVLNMAVPSGSSGGEGSVVAEIAEVEEGESGNSTVNNTIMQTPRVPPVVTINKSAVYALYQLTYVQDVSYKPQELFYKTRKCEPNADSKVVDACQRLLDQSGRVIDYTEPICCPCGPHRRVPSSCGNFFDRYVKGRGKANTAHCVRFPGDWFHVFGIGKQTIGFSVTIEVKTANTISAVSISPENKTVVSQDNFLRVNLIGDFAGYTSVPSFEDFFLVIPRQGQQDQPTDMGGNISMWMLLERNRFTLDGVECNKIGVSYQAFKEQPDFCASPFGSCLHNQLWNYMQADENRISRNQLPLYKLERRFERINEHPNAGPISFSIGITENVNTNLLIELSADDIEYVYQRSSGVIVNITIPSFETLTQHGVATITTKNTGDLEASYSLAVNFNCSSKISLMEEQFFIMKPKEVSSRVFTLSPSTDKATVYTCKAILKDSNFKEVDRAECQFSTTSTTWQNGTQIEPNTHRRLGFFQLIGSFLEKLWSALIDFITGRKCRKKCSSFLNLRCHVQYMCLTWTVLMGLILAIIPTVAVLVWLLNEDGAFGSDEETHRHSHHKRRRRVHEDHRRRPTTHDRHRKRRTNGHRHHHLPKHTKPITDTHSVLLPHPNPPIRYTTS